MKEFETQMEAEMAATRRRFGVYDESHERVRPEIEPFDHNFDEPTPMNGLLPHLGFDPEYNEINNGLLDAEERFKMYGRKRTPYKPQHQRDQVQMGSAFESTRQKSTRGIRSKLSFKWNSLISRASRTLGRSKWQRLPR